MERFVFFSGGDLGWELGIALAFDENELPAFWRENLGGIPFHSIPVHVLCRFAGWLKNKWREGMWYTYVAGWWLESNDGSLHCGMLACYCLPENYGSTRTNQQRSKVGQSSSTTHHPVNPNCTSTSTTLQSQ